MTASVLGVRARLTLALCGAVGVAALVLRVTEGPVFPTATDDGGQAPGAVAEAQGVAEAHGATAPGPKSEPPVGADAVATQPSEVAAVELVICLDTSGSMSALLDTVRHRLWEIVQAVDLLAPDAELRVALLTFGSPGVEGGNAGDVVVRHDLTEDLDDIYAAAMALTTAGGDEYVGWAVHTALHDLSWSEQAGAQRILFVAGNESADQGPETHDFRTVLKDARARGVRVNAMFAGTHDQGVREHWRDVAQAGGGMYAAIDKQRGTVDVATPFDDEMSRLNDALNASYVPYGQQGASKLQQVLGLDQAAKNMGSRGSGSRFEGKGGGKYKVHSWELVEAHAEGRIDLDGVDTDRLGGELKGLETAELAAALENRAAQRATIKAEITAVGVQRKAWLADWEARQGAGESLDSAMRSALEEQLGGS